MHHEFISRCLLKFLNIKIGSNERKVELKCRNFSFLRIRIDWNFEISTRGYRRNDASSWCVHDGPRSRFLFRLSWKLRVLGQSSSVEWDTEEEEEEERRAWRDGFRGEGCCCCLTTFILYVCGLTGPWMNSHSSRVLLLEIESVERIYIYIWIA